MKKLLFLLTILCLPLFCASAISADVANSLFNPGFENALTGGGGGWDGNADRGISNPIVADAPQGQKVLRLSEPGIGGAELFSFTFQFFTSGFQEGNRVVFDGLTRMTVQQAADEAQIGIEFRDGANALISSTFAASSAAAFTRIRVAGNVPPGTAVISFVIRIQPSFIGGTSVAEFDDMRASISALPVQIDAASASGVKSAGQVTMINTRLRNISAETIQGVEVVAQAAGGITILPNQSFVDGRPVGQHEGSVVFEIGDLAPGQDSSFAFGVLLSSGLVPGRRYEFTVFARTAAGVVLSSVVRINVEVELDPLFHLGTIIGKVFHDANENGIQDMTESGEEWGIPNVRLATERGVVVYTDRYGRYSIPAVPPGRTVVKIDTHSLPKGTRILTEESYVTRITEGMLAKVNFAVSLPKDEIPREFEKQLKVNVIQELDRITPELALGMNNYLLKAGEGMLESPAVFLLHCNYASLINEWVVEIRDEMGREVWTGIGRGAIPSQVEWDGKDGNGDLVKPGDYAVRLMVIDGQYHEDWTQLSFFRVTSKLNRWLNAAPQKPFSTVGYFNIMSDGKRSIPFSGVSSLRIQGYAPQSNQVMLNNHPVQLDQDGYFESTLLVPNGAQTINVTSLMESGESVVYQKEIQVNDHYFFMVGLGEEEMGFNKLKGNVETVGKDHGFRDGFYQDGRVAYYLKGKIKGKFLVTSSYDSEDQNSRGQLFTNLDPDEYYPVYGDGSRRVYDGSESEDKFYLMIEMDKSFLRWGSYNSDFTDTELSTHNRTMTGAKLHYETLRSTPYGDPKYGFSGFTSDQKHSPSHEEFRGTGGSLYYLRHRPLVEGSEKLRVEVRDKFTGIILSRRDLLNGQDYEIDYSSGRLILSEPLFSVSAADTVINNNILEGNANFLIVDYEYEDFHTTGFGTSGIRGFYHMGEYVRLGGTYIEDKAAPNDRNYTLRGVDSRVNLGKTTQLTAEYAETENTHANGFISTDGGLSFTNPGTSNIEDPKQSRNGAYVIRIQSRPVQRLDVSAYAQKFNPWFHNADTVFSQGDTKKYGVEANFRVTPYFTLRSRWDNTHIIKKVIQTTQTDRAKFYTAQGIYDDGTVLGTLEYQHQDIKLPTEDRRIDSIFSQNGFDDAVGAKLGYRINEKYMPYVRAQASWSDQGKSNNQIGGGIEARITDRMTMSMEQNFGNIGDSTQLRIETQTAENATSYFNIATAREDQFGKGVQATVGATQMLDSRSRLFSEKVYTAYHGDNYARNVTGVERSFFDDRVGMSITFERGESDRPRETGQTFPNPYLTNALATGITYKEGEWLKASSRYEYRNFSGTGFRDHQWLSYNDVSAQVTEDLELSGRLNFSKTRNVSSNNTLANFVEFNTGFAYRPIAWDRFNMLGRYTFFEENPLDNRVDLAGVSVEDRAHIWALEFLYDLSRYFQLVEKVAFKYSQTETSFGSSADIYNYLWVNRLNYHLTRKWDLAMEYRILTQEGAAYSFKHGALLEVDREILDYVRFGLGYNFTDFDDDLRPVNDYQTTSQGPFMRLTGKF